jgi:hypothetical protein
MFALPVDEAGIEKKVARVQRVVRQTGGAAKVPE